VWKQGQPHSTEEERQGCGLTAWAGVRRAPSLPCDWVWGVGQEPSLPQTWGPHEERVAELSLLQATGAPETGDFV
jgi:hypothetical protein